VLAAWEQEARNAGDSSAEAMALARLRAGWGSVALASAGGISLSNRAERAQIIPLPGGNGRGFAAEGSPGRGLDAYRAALACDPVSAFGGIVAANRTLDAEAAKAITEIFTEVIIAPDATGEAIALIGAKKNLRLLLTGGLPDPRAAGFVSRTIAGGSLVQSRDDAVVDDMALKVVTNRAPTEAEMADLRFAYRVVKHVKSNAIVYARNGATVGIGAGQMSRVDSARIAAWKAGEAAKALGSEKPLTVGSVAASDAFFPFADGLEALVAAGATAVIQPGGSMRDPEVIEAANKAGLAMVFTGTRHFRH
jgi:phosphoribosylaminoimidazolecarboxamide formyltransferase/IMP cyclohydrolase